MSKLTMRDDEIANSYRLAKDPEAQVKVLAELNDTTPENIKRILVEREVYVPPMQKAQKTAEKKAKHRWTEEELNRAEDMFRSGYSYRQIAKELGTKENATRVTVGKWMREKEKSGGEENGTEKKTVQQEAGTEDEQQDIIVRCKPGGIAHLATMMSVVQKWIAQGSEVTLNSVETDESGGVMVAIVDGLLVFAEVPIR